MRKTMIVVHSSDTTSTTDIGVAEIRRWHVNERGWRDIGYALVIRRDGTIEHGRDLDKDGDVLEETGAHARGFNKVSIGICLIGGRSPEGRPEANFTLAQYAALKFIIGYIKTLHPTITKVVGHNELNSNKACPCFNVEALLN